MSVEGRHDTAFLAAKRFTIKMEFRACLVSRHLSLDENWLYPSQGPLRVITSHSRFALVSMRNHAESEMPEEEAAILEHMSEVSCEYIIISTAEAASYRFPSLKRTEALFARYLREERIV